MMIGREGHYGWLSLDVVKKAAQFSCSCRGDWLAWWSKTLAIDCWLDCVRPASKPRVVPSKKETAQFCKAAALASTIDEISCTAVPEPRYRVSLPECLLYICPPRERLGAILCSFSYVVTKLFGNLQAIESLFWT